VTTTMAVRMRSRGSLIYRKVSLLEVGLLQGTAPMGSGSRFPEGRIDLRPVRVGCP
jgi:hypothetical protein